MASAARAAAMSSRSILTLRSVRAMIDLWSGLIMPTMTQTANTEKGKTRMRHEIRTDVADTASPKRAASMPPIRPATRKG